MPSPAEAGSPDAHALYREAQAQRESGRLASAEACFRKALHLFHREGALAQAMKSLSGIASTQELKGRLPLALRTQRWILRLCADGSRIEGRFWALCDMAFLLMRLGRAAEAKARLSDTTLHSLRFKPSLSPGRPGCDHRFPSARRERTNS